MFIEKIMNGKGDKLTNLVFQGSRFKLDRDLPHPLLFSEKGRLVVVVVVFFL